MAKKKSFSSKAIEPTILPPDDEEVSEEDPDNEDFISELGSEKDEGLEYGSNPENLPVVRENSLPTKHSEEDFPSLGSNDPLKLYLDELKKYPLLSPEDEYRLVMRMLEQGDREAAKRLVTANLRLVVKIAMDYRNLFNNALDLIQEGNLGLLKAVSKYDPTKGARLGYYASWWIRSYILKYLLDNFRLVKIGTTQAQKRLFYHLMREKEKLEAQGFLSGPKLLAEKLNVPERDVIEMEKRLSHNGAEVSIDSPMRSDESSETFSALLEDTRDGADTTLEHSQLLSLLSKNLTSFSKTLDEREKKIFKERLLSDNPKTLQEVADKFGLTRERVRQIESKVMDKLKVFVKPTFEPTEPPKKPRSR